MKTKILNFLAIAVLSVIILPTLIVTVFALEASVCDPGYVFTQITSTGSGECRPIPGYMGSLPAGQPQTPLPPVEPVEGGYIPSNSGCTALGGSCMDKSACTGTSKSDLCLAPEYKKQLNIQCCVTSKISPSGSSGGSIEIPNPLKTKSIAELIDRIVNYVIGIATLIFPLIIIYGAWQFLSTGGDMEKVTTARKTITYAVIGYILILLSKGVTMIVAQFLGAN